MQEVFEELIRTTGWLACSGILGDHTYADHQVWAVSGRIDLTRCSVQVKWIGRFRYWHYVLGPTRGLVANFSAYVRHHQNQYNNNE